MTVERRQDVAFKLMTLILSGVVAWFSAAKAIEVSLARVETRMAAVEARQLRLTEMIDKLDAAKVGKDEHKTALESVTNRLDDIQATQSEILKVMLRQERASR